VAIARALAAQPECVLYDEPTTMVDPIMSDHLSDLMAAAEEAAWADFDRGDARFGPDV
jgi:ABC-type transporter Mla maintaining outer membrane lipid asymmetry ATPase subunit MlaF